MKLLNSWNRLRRHGLTLDSAGSLSRAGTLRRIVSLLPLLQNAASPLLVDFNPSKLKPATELWPKITFLNPFEVRPCLLERVLLAVSLVLLDVPRRALQAIGIGITLRRAVPTDTKVCIWNPYSMFHFGVAEMIGVVEVSVLTPEYPLPRRVKRIHGPEVIRSIYGLDESIFVPIEIEHSFVRDDVVLAIYLTKTEVSQRRGTGWAEHRQIRRIEERLIAFGVEMSRRGVRTEFFLHYSDRTDEALARLPAELGQLVNLGDSLRTLSRRQIGLSGVSTIGFQLSSLGIPQAFVLTTAEGEQTPYITWARDQDNVLDVELSDDEWVLQLSRCFPDAASAVFRYRPNWYCSDAARGSQRLGTRGVESLE